jgi:LmbE family N-acetylglucosaminyl deacetylase
MNIDKKSILAPILSIGLLGGLGIAQVSGQSQIDFEDNTLTDSIELSNLSFDQPVTPTPQCQSRVMQVVAHEDDDLLFMNPDLAHDLSNGVCVQTVYLTAGDAGQGSDYWPQRERGAEAAYSKMLGLPMEWQTSQTTLSNHYIVNEAVPKQAASVSLIFVRLPDGNLFGDGFANTGNESLQKLEAGQISVLHTLDAQTSYSLNDLTNLLASVINRYQPDEIRTQANDNPDHSDHTAAGRLTTQAYQLFRSRVIAIKSMSLSFYNGYTTSSLPQNLAVEDISRKQTAFWEYAKYDNAVCETLDACNNTSTYGFYLDRQYKSQG